MTVVTHEKFLDKEKINDLKSQGIDILDASHDKEIELDGPGYGETEIGVLTEDEKAIFRSLYFSHNQMRQLERELRAIAHESLATSLREDSGTPKPKTMEQIIESLYENMPEAVEKKLKTYHRLGRKISYLKELFYWSIGEKYDLHHHKIGIRSKFRIVDCGSKI